MSESMSADLPKARAAKDLAFNAPAHSTPGRLGAGIIGAGKVGAVLGAALRAAGHGVIGVSARSEASQERAENLLPGVPVLEIADIVERAELVILAVPDDALEDLVGELADRGAWQNGQLAVHTAGRFGVGVLAPVRPFGTVPLAIHPAMTFTGLSLDLNRLVGSAFAVTADSTMLPVAQALVVEMGGEPVVVAEADRPAYHAALAHSANHLVTLTAQAVQVLDDIGVDNPDRVLGPLMRAALENALASGQAALTGPVARGDAGTLRAHLDALAELAPDVRQSYRHLALTTLLRASDTGLVDQSQVAAIEAVLAEPLDKEQR